MIQGCKKISYLSLGVLISIGLFSCNGNKSTHTGIVGTSWGDTKIGISSGSGTANDTGTGTDTLADTETDTGTDTGTGTGTGAGSGTGTGGCVNFPRPVVGQKTKTEFKGAGEGLDDIVVGEGIDDVSVSSITEVTVTAVSDTSITQRIENLPLTSSITTPSLPSGSADLLPSATSTSIETETFTIANNYRDITKSTSTTTSIFSFGGIETETEDETETTYDPYFRRPVDRVCEGQVWDSTYTIIEEGEDPEQVSLNFTIEAVNVSRTTPAGTFNTFRVLGESGESTGTVWIDIATGVEVFRQSQPVDDSSISVTWELIEIN